MAPLRLGEVVRGEMPAGDPDTSTRLYRFAPDRDAKVTIEASSLDFDTGLRFEQVDTSGTVITWAVDDDGRLGTDSRLAVDVEAGAIYRITVHPVVEDWGGEFTLSVREGDVGSIDPASRDTAEKEYWNQVLERAKAGGKPGREIRAIVGLGQVHQRAGFPAMAQESYETAVRRSEESFGPGDPVLATSLNSLGHLLLNLGRPAEARPHFERALAIRERALGPDHPEVALSLNNLADVLNELGETREASALLERALAIRLARWGPNHGDVAWNLESLAYVSISLGDFERALDYAERAVATREAIWGAAAPEVCDALNAEWVVRWQMGEYQRAKALIERCMRNHEKTYGPDHPALAVLLSSLAVMTSDTGDYEEGLRLHERALAIQEKQYGPDSPALIADIHNVAFTLDKMGSFAEARRMYERVIAIEEKHLGSDNVSTANSYHNLGFLLKRMGFLEEAKSYLERGLAVYEKVRGPDHPDVAIGLSGLASLLDEEDRPGEALPLRSRAVGIFEHAFGEDSVRVAAARNSIAGTLRDLGRFEEARGHAEEALRVREAGLGPAHPDVASSLQTLAGILKDQGKLEEAESAASRARGILLPVFGEYHPRIGECALDLAGIHAAAGETARAVTEALTAERIGREHLRLTSRHLPEAEALRYATARTSGIDLALTLVALEGAGIPAAQVFETWDALARSRSLVLDEIMARHALTREASRIAGAAERLAAASARLANLTVRGPGDLSLDQYHRMVDDARTEREQAERVLADRSGEFRDREAQDRLGLRNILDRLPPRSALVAVVLFHRRSDVLPVSTARDASTGSRDRDGEPTYLAFLGRAGGTGVAVVPLGPAVEIDRRVAAWRQSILAQAAGTASGSEEDYRRRGTKLREAIWDPIAPHLDGIDLVILVPDGTLNLVSYASLPVGPQEYLVEGHVAIHIVSAERDILVPDRRREGGEVMLALGAPAFDAGPRLASAVAHAKGTEPVGTDEAGPRLREARPGCNAWSNLNFMPLPGTSEEIEGITTLWRRAGPDPRNVVRLSGLEATESEFRARAPSSRIIHLATHGFFLERGCDPASPRGTRGIGSVAAAEVPPAIVQTPGVNPLLLSGLALSGANRHEDVGLADDDGVLTAEEIAGIDLSSAEWVVLSACDTGLGEIRAGEGVFGLRRAVQVAGAGTLIMSLWPVEDEAARRWMEDLYTARLFDRVSTAEAVRTASRRSLAARREAGQSTHPFYWAPFVAAGDWR